MLRKLRFELFNGNHRRIIHAADAKEQLVVAAILLSAVAGKARIHVMIEAFQGLQDADRRMKGGRIRAFAAHKRARTPKRNQIKPQPAQSEEGRNAFKDDSEHECSVYRAQNMSFAANVTRP